MNLLNNDYYLDLKTEAINLFVENIIKQHIEDDNIHFPWEKVEALIKATAGITKNTIYRLPLYQNNQDFGISKLKQIITDCPKNLNRYNLIFEFCIPASEVLNSNSGIDISNDPNATNYYKNILKLSPDDISSTTKKGPTELNEIYLSKNIEDSNFSFDTFYGGNLIIYGNSYFFVDDISNPNVFDEEADEYTTTQTLKYLQQQIIKSSTPSSDQKIITLKGRGINAKYSVLSLRNNFNDCYIFNLKIENNLIAGTNINYGDYDFPEFNDIIIYWPMNKNFVPQIINTDYLNSAQQYILQSQSVIISGVVNNDETNIELQNISAPIMNTSLNKETDGSSYPGYLWLDKRPIDGDTESKIQSNDLKNIIYNKTGKNPNTTIIVWAYQTDRDSHNNPFLSDYNCDTKKGLYISHEVLKKNFEDFTNNTEDTQETFLTDFSKIEDIAINNWIMYVYEFQHAGGTIPTDRAPWTTSKWQIPPEEGKMRINISAYYRKKGSSITENILLLPTLSNLTYGRLNEFDIPIIEDTTNLNFFGCKYANILNSVNPLDGWALWNGAARNIIIFNKFLNGNQLRNLYNKFIYEYYEWAEFGEYEVIKSINKNSYLGSLYAYNTKNLNIESCIFKQNIKTLNDITFS